MVTDAEEFAGCTEHSLQDLDEFVQDLVRARLEVVECRLAEFCVFRAVLQHGPANPIKVEDDEEYGSDLEIDVDHLGYMPELDGLGRLVPIEDEIVAADVAADLAAADPAPLYEEAPPYEGSD